MKSKLLYISIISLLFIIQACKRTEPDCGDLSDVITNYNIADSNKAKIPYIGTDTLVFISDAGDTATLIGQGKNTHYESVRRNISGGDCPRSSVTRYENIDINYSGDDTTINAINFNLRGIDNSFPYNSIRIFINGTSYSDYSTIEYFDAKNPNQDSLFINNKYQYGLYMSNNIILFNLKLGILKIKDYRKSKIWMLNNKN
jgi:hypothetical protein